MKKDKKNRASWGVLDLINLYTLASIFWGWVDWEIGNFPGQMCGFVNNYNYLKECSPYNYENS